MDLIDPVLDNRLGVWQAPWRERMAVRAHWLIRWNPQPYQDEHLALDNAVWSSCSKHPDGAKLAAGERLVFAPLKVVTDATLNRSYCARSPRYAYLRRRSRPGNYRPGDTARNRLDQWNADRRHGR